jgi:hypothetical protein
MIGGIIEQRGSRTSKGGRRMAKPSSWSASVWQAIPFWAACFVLVSWYPMFYPPAWDQKLYWDTLDFTEAEYQGSMTWGTIGMMLSFVPSTVVGKYGEGAAMWCGAACCTFAYVCFAIGWSGYFTVSGWKLYALAFLIGQSTAFVKMAGLSIVAHTVDAAQHAGKSMGLLFACLEFGACMYAQITEIWCVWGCAMWGKTSVAIRHSPMTVVSVLMGRVMRRPEAGAPKVDPRYTLQLPYLYIGLAGLFTLASINWFGQTSWCYQTVFEWTAQLLRGDISGFGITFLNCWIPTLMILFWGCAFVGMVSISHFHVEITGMISHLVTAVSPSRTPGVEVWTTVEDASGGDEESTSSAKNSKQDNNDSVSSAEDDKEGIWQTPRVPSRWSFVSLVVVPGMTLGIGQAIGISYWTIAAMYEADKSGHGGIMKIAGTYLLTRMLGSVVVGFLWDADSDASVYEILVGGLGFVVARGGKRGGKSSATSASKAPTPKKIRHAVLRPFVVMMLVAQVVFAAGWTTGAMSDVTVFTGFALSGLSTGAMNALVPILALHHYGSKGFCKSFSYMMSAAIVFQGIFYNGVENTIYWNNYGKNDPDTVLVYSDDLNFKDYYNWGGCNMRSSCYRASFVIQAVALLVPVFMCGRLVREEEERQLAEVADKPALDAEEGDFAEGDVPGEQTALLGGVVAAGSQSRSRSASVAPAPIVAAVSSSDPAVPLL